MVKIPKMQRKHVGLLWMVFALIFCTSLGNSLEDRKLIQGLLSEFNLVSASENSDDYLWQVEVLAINCRVELIHVKHIYEDFSLVIPEALRKIKIHYDQVLLGDYVQKALRSLDPQIKQNLYNCLRENFHISPVSGEDDRPAGWFQKHLASLLPMSNPTANSRRRLAEKAPSPAPSPKRSGSKLKAPPPVDTFVIPIPIAPSLDKDTADTGSDTHSGDHTTIIVAVSVTAVATFLVSLVLFLCCRKAFGGGSGLDHKDDRPLLSLSTSSSSISGSSPTAWGYDGSFNKEKIGNQPYASNLSNKVGAVDSGGILSSGTADTASTDASSFKYSTESSGRLSTNASSSALKPPPGRTGASGPGLSNLKPPPGRANPLPPEPPASSRPSPGMGGPPPPPSPPPKAPAAPPPPNPKAPAAPPPNPKAPAAPPPPPPKKSGPPPPGPPPPPGGKPGRAPPRPPSAAVKAGSSSADADANAKAKLKPFFWDKVMASDPDHSMVWDQIKSGSFQFNEEMIESLFGYASAENKNEKKKDSSSRDPPSQFIQLIDQKKAQNLSILLRALNVTTEEVRDALEEGNELPAELLETLLKMAPTSEEELKLRLFNGELSQLGPAERFLKVMVDIPFAFKRIEVLLFMGTLQEEATSVKENVVTLEAACKELRNSRLFLKLLEAVLKTGNRMNDGTYRGGAQAFRLDTLLKLADVKGTDGKTTLLHFVVQEIIRSEGVRAVRAARESRSMSSIKSDDLLEDVPDDSEEHYRNLGLQVVSGLGDQLQNVRKAACIDSESLTGTIAKLGSSLLKAKKFLDKEMDEVQEDMGFHKALKSFVEHAEGDVMKLLEEEKRIMALVKSTADYFHGNSGKEEGLRLFVIIRDFLIMLERVCREVKARPKWPSKNQKKEPPARQTSTETPRTPLTPDFRQRLFPAIAERKMDGSSSDDD